MAAQWEWKNGPMDVLLNIQYDLTLISWSYQKQIKIILILSAIEKNDCQSNNI